MEGPAGEENPLTEQADGRFATPRDGPLGTWVIDGDLEVEVVETTAGEGPVDPLGLDLWSERSWAKVCIPGGRCTTWVARFTEHSVVSLELPEATAPGWTADVSFADPLTGTHRFVLRAARVEVLALRTSGSGSAEADCPTVRLVSPLGEVRSEQTRCLPEGCSHSQREERGFAPLGLLLLLGFRRRR